MKITLDNGRISRMVADHGIAAEFTFLSSMTVEHRSCCGRAAGTSPDYENIRKAIASLSDDRKSKLKEMLKVDEVTVHYHSGGTIQTVRF